MKAQEYTMLGCSGKIPVPGTAQVLKWLEKNLSKIRAERVGLQMIGILIFT